MDLLPTFDEKREILRKLILKEGIIFQDVRLSSKIKSPYYYDIKRVMNSWGVNLIGELMFAKIKEIYPEVKSVGGLESGAIGIVTAVVFTSNKQLRKGNRVTGFFVRKERKKHGLEKVIEGIPEHPLVVVDDVITTGQSVIDAINELEKGGYHPKGIISVMDRQDKRNKLKKKKWKYNSLFKHSEFEQYIDSKLERKDLVNLKS